MKTTMFCRACGARQKDFYEPCRHPGRGGYHEVYIEPEAETQRQGRSSGTGLSGGESGKEE